jgi:NAD-dependent dihydropyrimidine dehydrogenase PreA subunit
MPAVVNREECVSCGTCVEECPEEAIALDDEEIAVVNPDKCTECGTCVEACPSEAISIGGIGPGDVKNGRVEVENGSGEEESGHVEEESGLEEVAAGPSTHIATDSWTLDDTLGYDDYAHAIYRFMTSKDTKCPLTISIQAPWGGGKTSLMKMTRKKLDPDAEKELLPVEKEDDEVFSMRLIRIIRTFINPSANEGKDLTIKEVMNKIKNGNKFDDLKRDKDLFCNFTKGTEEDPHLLTVWFNAWKYQSTNQVWAGLVDAIIHQISNRLNTRYRELFLLELNVRRVDTDKIRFKIYERILNITWENGTYGLWLASIAFLGSLGAYIAGWNIAGWIPGADGMMLSMKFGLLYLIVKVMHAIKKANGEPASLSLSEYLQVPDYNPELGFIHHVEADLRRVLELVPTVDSKSDKRLVIFIDDLDRCSPQKVSNVVEGVNLFLAGEFPGCMLVIGMDAEMVAAALESAHKEVKACLPADACTPVGWRFMDKFVQLPFIIPPANKKDLESYTTALLSIKKKADPDPKVPRQDDDHEAEVREAERAKRRKIIDRGIRIFSDENEKIREMILNTAANFSHNPRELKRFINTFRFQYFLWWAQLVRGKKDAVSKEQLRRWVVLSMKWPGVVRWVQHSGGRDQISTIAEKDQVQPSRLRKLELMGEKAEDMDAWKVEAKKIIWLDERKAPWLNDDDLRQFFLDESKFPESERLSDGEGKGLW